MIDGQTVYFALDNRRLYAAKHQENETIEVELL